MNPLAEFFYFQPHKSTTGEYVDFFLQTTAVWWEAIYQSNL